MTSMRTMNSPFFSAATALLLLLCLARSYRDICKGISMSMITSLVISLLVEVVCDLQ